MPTEYCEEHFYDESSYDYDTSDQTDLPAQTLLMPKIRTLPMPKIQTLLMIALMAPKTRMALTVTTPEIMIILVIPMMVAMIVSYRFDYLITLQKNHILQKQNVVF